MRLARWLYPALAAVCFAVIVTVAHASGFDDFYTPAATTNNPATADYDLDGFDLILDSDGNSKLDVGADSLTVTIGGATKCVWTASGLACRSAATTPFDAGTVATSYLAVHASAPHVTAGDIEFSGTVDLNGNNLVTDADGNSGWTVANDSLTLALGGATVTAATTSGLAVTGTLSATGTISTSAGAVSARNAQSNVASFGTSGNEYLGVYPGSTPDVRLNTAASLGWGTTRSQLSCTADNTAKWLGSDGTKGIVWDWSTTDGTLSAFAKNGTTPAIVKLGTYSALSSGSVKGQLDSTGVVLSSDACTTWKNNTDLSAGTTIAQLCYAGNTGRVKVVGNGVAGEFETVGTGTTDSIVYNDDGVQGRTRGADEVPNAVTLRSQSAYEGASSNTTGSDLDIAAGDGTTKISVGTYTNCGGSDSFGFVIDGTTYTVACNTGVTCATSAATVCANIATQAQAAVGATTVAAITCSGSDVRVRKGLTTRTISVTSSDATCATASNGTDGFIKAWHPIKLPDGSASTVAIGRGSDMGTGFWFSSSTINAVGNMSWASGAGNMTWTSGGLNIAGGAPITFNGRVAVSAPADQDFKFLDAAGTAGFRIKWTVDGQPNFYAIDGSTRAFGKWGFLSIMSGSNTKTYLSDTGPTMSSDSEFKWRGTTDVGAGADDTGLKRGAAGYVKTTNGAGTVAFLTTKQPRATQATSTTLSCLNDTLTWYDNTGATGLVTLTLPAPLNGCTFEFLATDTDGIKVLAASGAVIYATAGSSAANGFIKSVVQGSYAKCISDGTNWQCVNNGTWTVDL